MRQYIRHPIAVPLCYQLSEELENNSSQTTNISVGGLCFSTDEHLPPGKNLRISIHIGDAPFETEGEIVWCNSCPLGFEAGICFKNEDDAYAARMVEQVCHIEQYRQHIRDQEHRELTQEQAAREWIDKHASEFPSWDE